MNLMKYSHPVIAAYVRNQLSVIQEYVSLRPDIRLLEVGCGNGHFTYYLDRMCDVTGIDISQHMLALNPVKKTRLMDVSHMEFDDESFDVVFCHGTLHHAADPEAIMGEMRRVTRKYVVVVEPNRNNPIMLLRVLFMKVEFRALAFSLGHVRRMAQRAGLSIEDAFSYGMLIPALTPEIFLSLAELGNFRQSFGWDNFVIAYKDG